MYQHALNWFEIPAADFSRAVKFYNEVLQCEMHTQDMNGIEMAFLPMQAEQGVGGTVCAGEFYKPSGEGTMVYLNGGEDLNIPLSRVENAGGKILVKKTKITDEIGYMAVFLDSEGNKVAFHSPK